VEFLDYLSDCQLLKNGALRPSGLQCCWLLLAVTVAVAVAVYIYAVHFLLCLLNVNKFLSLVNKPQDQWRTRSSKERILKLWASNWGTSSLYPLPFAMYHKQRINPPFSKIKGLVLIHF
jgi:hypothetical protein